MGYGPGIQTLVCSFQIGTPVCFQGKKRSILKKSSEKGLFYRPIIKKNRMKNNIKFVT
jgi:hypothetical protein